MNTFHHLSPTEFFKFIAQPELVVVFLSIHPAHRINHLLAQRLTGINGVSVAFGQLSLRELVDPRCHVFLFLSNEIRSIGAITPSTVLPGYYLFQNSQLLAWDSGLPKAVDTKSILHGSLLGIAISLIMRDPRYLRIAVRSATTACVAERIAEYFIGTAAYHRDNPRRPSAQHAATHHDDVAEAYRVLQVDPSASDAEVQRAWRILAQRFHPDRSAGNPEEFERLSRHCIEINRARDIIRNHRRRAHRSATAG